MADFTLVKSGIKLLDNVTVAAGGSQSASYDMRTAHGGVVSVQIKNGATGPTIPCCIYVGISHLTGVTPATSKVWGTDWYKMAELFGTSTNADIRNFMPLEIPSGVQHIEVIATDNTAQPVTVSVSLSVVTKVVSA